jgi:zinc protease
MHYVSTFTGTSQTIRREGLPTCGPGSGRLILDSMQAKTPIDISRFPVLITRVSAALVFCLLFAFAVQAGVTDRIYETSLTNGLKVILLENRKAPIITFQVWYRVGSRDESWGKTGLSHLLEHMMFKGTKTRGPEQFSRIIQQNGGDDNAFTSSDYTGYFTNISADRVDVPLKLEADRMANLLLREEDFATEKMVVIEERRLRTEDNPQAYLAEQLEAAAFQVQPYHWPIIGWMADLDRLTLADLKEHYATFYTPANAFLVVVGDFETRDMLRRIEEAFGSVAAGKAPGKKRFTEASRTGERRITVRREAMQPSIVTAYNVPNLEHPDSYVLEVIEGLLSSGKSSRLHRRLVREQRLALSADAENSFLSVDPRLFYLSAEPLPGTAVEEIEKAFAEEIEKLKTNPADALELEKIVNQMEAQFVYGQDSVFFQAMVIARYEIASTWRKIDEYIPSIRTVSPEDIMRVAQKYFTPDNRTTGVLVPIPPVSDKAITPHEPLRDRSTR